MNILLQICDSVLLKMHECADHCSPVVEKTVNTSNPEITKMVCGTIVILAIIAAVTILLWKLIDFWAESSKAKREREHKAEDVRREQIAEYRKKELDLLKEDKEKSLAKLDSYLKSL